MSELFDLSEQYTEMLKRGLRLSGEDQQYFLVGRVRHLEQQLPPGWEPRRILDFGCGIGHTAQRLSETFLGAEVVGVDTAEKALAWAETRYASPRVSFRPVQSIGLAERFDLCYTNGVFHHIPPQERPAALGLIYRSLWPGAYFALFENNPWNPGTRLVMSRIPFDRDAVTLRPSGTRRLLREAGFQHCATRFLFYFPRPLAVLRVTEPWLRRIPLGAQYCVLARKKT